MMRSKVNVKTEITLLAIAYDIKKLAPKISQKRMGVSLFKLRSA